MYINFSLILLCLIVSIILILIYFVSRYFWIIALRNHIKRIDKKNNTDIHKYLPSLCKLVFRSCKWSASGLISDVVLKFISNK